MEKVQISKQAIARMPYYIRVLKAARDEGLAIISAPAVAARLGLNEVQVRKDFAAVSSAKGRPKTGFEIGALIAAMETFLGCNNVHDAVLVGAGSLGRALISYRGFGDYGLNIVAAFDADPSLSDAEIGGCRIYPAEKLEELCARLKILIGIITVPASQAQAVCDVLCRAGVKAIWNFAPAHLVTPPGVLVQSENMAASLAMLSQHLKEHLAESGE